MTDSTPTDHLCPGCGKKLRWFARYPWYLCSDCLDLAEDAEGRRLVFGNMSPLSGGLFWSYAEDPSRAHREAISVLCLIQGRPVLVTEARFGGVVAQPTNTLLISSHDRETLVDLSHPERLDQAREKLQPWTESRDGRGGP